jgi:hypothetical protein
MTISESYAMMIGGKAATANSGKTFDVLNPATGQRLCSVPEGDAADIDAAVRAGQAASTVWGAMAPLERATILNRAAEILARRMPEFVAVEVAQTGRPVREMRAQLARTPEWYSYFASVARTHETHVHPFGGAYLNYSRRIPLGVVGLVTPWNHPLLILTKKVAPALAAGNTVVVKPSEVAPITPLMLAAANGYGFAVRWILGREAGRATLGRRDQDGLTALDLARLAVRQTALACRPRADGRGVEKPLLTTLAYYLDRRPYPSVVRALVDAGAGAGPARARAHWLAVCPGAPPDLRARVDRGAALQRTLLQGAHDILLARCTEQARLRHRGILRLFGGREDATGVIDQSREQVQARIEACAADLAGFVPD